MTVAEARAEVTQELAARMERVASYVKDPQCCLSKKQIREDAEKCLEIVREIKEWR